MDKEIKKIVTLVWLAFFLSSCAMAPNSEQTLKNRLQLTQDITERYQVSEDWWVVYNDSQLNQLIQKALLNNIDLAQSALAVNKALYQANLLTEDFLPSFSGDTTRSVSKDIKHGTPSTQSIGANLSISYEVDLWRKLADSANAKEWEYKATVLDKETAKLALMNSVVDIYFNLVYLHESIAVAKMNIKNYEKINQLVSYKYEYGRGTSLDLSQSKQSLLSAQGELIELQSQQKIVKQTLRNLLNLKPHDPLALQYPNFMALKLAQVDLNVPLSVLANRPDLRAAEYRLQEAFLDKSAVEKTWYPTITLGAAVNASSDKTRTVFNMPLTSGNISIDLPFLQWNKVRWNIKISEIDYNNTKLSFEKSLTTALNEVDTNYYAYSKALDALDNASKKYGHDVSISGYYKIRYEQGAGELSDWLNALNTQNSSKLSVLNSRYRVIQYENMIYKAMAGRYTARVLVKQKRTL